ncbi:DUF99 family protein [Candidatus Woesearchaeota archaeon]|nr:MAG: DUF99 family protein [Candidatus Woesearchaeota archaeon]
MRQEIRVIGIDDGPFFKFREGKTLIVGTLYRGGKMMDGLLSTTAQVDGSDSTTKIARMINRSKFRKQVRAILLDGITIGGFNVVNIQKLHEKTGIPVIAVVRRKPDIKKIIKTLKELGMNRKAKLIETMPEPQRAGKVWVQTAGTSLERAKEIIKITTTYADIPEPLRIAHIIAAGIIRGESRGRA